MAESYSHLEVDRILITKKEYIKVLSKIIVYLLQDGCTLVVVEIKVPCFLLDMFCRSSRAMKRHYLDNDSTAA